MTSPKVALCDTKLAVDDLTVICVPEVRSIFDKYPKEVLHHLLQLRSLIITTAQSIEDLGALIETVKWGQPSYHPKRPKVGTTLRLGLLKNQPTQYAMFVHCQTSLVATFDALYPNIFTFEGNRAVIFDLQNKLPQTELKDCIRLALTYHRWKNKKFP